MADIRSSGTSKKKKICLGGMKDEEDYFFDLLFVNSFGFLKL